MSSYGWSVSLRKESVYLLIPVMTITCPFFLSLMTGRMAFMMFTLAKKLISKISSTRLIVRLLWASSSTAPITAKVKMYQLRLTQ